MKKNYSTINTKHLAVPVLDNLYNTNFLVLRESPDDEIKIGKNLISKININPIYLIEKISNLEKSLL